MPIFSPYAGDRELSTFFMQLGQLADSGVPITRTMDILVARMRGRAREIAVALRKGVGDGQSLREAAEPVVHRIPPLALEMLATGEDAGMLGPVCKNLSEHYAFRADLKRRTIGGLIYPVFLLAFAIHIPFLVDFVLGRGGFESLIQMYIWLACIIVLLVILGQLRGFRRALAEVGLAVPGIGWYLRTLAISNFTEAFRLMNDAGVGIVDTLNRSARASGNSAFARRIAASVDVVQRGQTIGEALSATSLFPMEYLAVLDTSEESGQLSIGLAKLSEQYRDKARSATAWLGRLIVGVIYAGVVIYIVIVILGFFVRYVQAINDAASGF